jgi:hypothetical protein
MKIKDRFLAPTPKFWRNIRNVMIGIGTISGAIIATPAALPVGLITLATYGLTIGSVGAALSQLTVEDKK